MRRVDVAAVAAALGWPAGQALAWGATGHEVISGIAIAQLPQDVPGFVRTPEAVADIAVTGRELDRSTGAGETHDKERDPGHFVDLSDDRKVMGIIPLDKPPVSCEAYDTQLRAGGPHQGNAMTHANDHLAHLPARAALTHEVPMDARTVRWSLDNSGRAAQELN
jgi:hypothetical protein